jgi:hypothetical protein
MIRRVEVGPGRWKELGQGCAVLAVAALVLLTVIRRMGTGDARLA